MKREWYEQPILELKDLDVLRADAGPERSFAASMKR
jgi:hypothetical protein